MSIVSRKIYVCAILMLQVSVCLASYGNMTLRIKSNPATLGMANAVAGMENGESAAEFNPACLVGAFGKSVSINYAAWPENMAFQQLLSSFRISTSSVLGFSVNAFQSGDIDSIDNHGDRTGRQYNNSAAAFGFSYAYAPAVLRLTGIGATLRYISERLEDASSNNVLFDAGLLFRIENNDRSRLGVAIRNFGSAPKFYDEEKTPVTVTCGISRWFCRNESALAAINCESSPEKPNIYSAGIEYRISMKDNMCCALRAGYTTERQDLGPEAGITAGFGLMWDKIGFDYAWRPSSLIGDTSVFGFRYLFSPTIPVSLNRYAKIQDYEKIEAYRKQIMYETKIRYEQRHIDAMQERDRAIFSQGVTEAEVSDVDRFKILAEEAAKKNNYDQAWSFINQANMKYRDLYIRASAKKMLEELRAQDMSKLMETWNLYQEGLKYYLKNEINTSIDRFEKYLRSGDEKYKTKAQKTCADAYARHGYDKLISGDIQGASNLWRRGMDLDNTNPLIKKYMSEYIAVKCDDYFNKGAIEYYNGKIDKARYYWELCEGLDLKYERAQKALRRIR